MSNGEYHPDVVNLMRNGRKPVYLNDLEIGHASNWTDVTFVLATFAMRLFGQRHTNGHRNKTAIQIAAVEDLETLTGKKLFFPRDSMVEGPDKFILNF
jgi:hypothetical protein